MQLTRTFNWGAAAITVHRSTIRDRMAMDVIAGELYDDNDSIIDIHGKNEFVAFVQRSVVVGDLGFAFPSANSSAAEKRSGLEAWLGMDEALYTRWATELLAVNVPVNNAALTPAAPKTPDGEPDPNASAPPS